ncbi:MAG: sn-glycerol-3-phosphate ABC transporter ATP-binding protein UgpC [Mesorhizobium sp.]|uniref:ABC transporter ATP-binding protein n=1 Tax=Mesorhizobium sp. TaxID=1871066 RepID=UPI000FE57D52|nr:sn-glycerol-3-phosphate ABC transporter ATP-binding protein UgpC [Mesorhizobium sp.]RWI27856.1 MAG: sn-glycerol-3-phosphate ABC transporter ATP-binding protein UgpC [Mesorhizobium sp.]RWK49497.1 MAG: sn-glycerol-3-phosphate ABC transporter ATP-binding protein UgpC [Mesorhizobium sp.]RWK94863.1 MAG: sn-glycerol-3-phosphate ABC transporter ATP-binding protein UgpC [Mesorhizobium sp.]TJW56942.1 MAG: sn-glycerol-3-phosphate ABC transporter ATP-binding protein UgpC [Mesorhizobium sp.]
MAEVRITGLHKRYGAFHAVRGIDLDIRDGEFTVLVGPSGCGKSTLLRTIAGLEESSEGTIEIGGEVVNDFRPRDRDVAMVFQDYALYPHMNVAKNIGFGLKARKMPRSEVEARVAEAARMLGITPLLGRFPRQLSGGQRQRVAIGRAIVRSPRIFLFDEPLSNLDAQLRDEMRGEIKRLHQDIATTMIYVTHDQIEAMTLADRIVLMRDGLIEQQGAPLELFERPASTFVAGFLGSPRMSFLPGTLKLDGGAAAIRLSEALLPVAPGRSLNGAIDGQAVLLGLRPEHLTRAHAATPALGTFRYDATIDLLQPTGSRSYATFRLAGAPVMAELQAHDVSRPGERLPIDINMNRASIFDARTERAI